VSVVVRPAALALVSGAHAEAPNHVATRVVARQFAGDQVELVLECAGLRLRATSDPYTAPDAGTSGTLHLRAERLVVVPRDTGDI
jgi:hypothetical protein